MAQVGAGPTGLSLALALVKNGIPVRIINKAQTVHQEQRGLGIQVGATHIIDLSWLT